MIPRPWLSDAAWAVYVTYRTAAAVIRAVVAWGTRVVEALLRLVGWAWAW